MLPFLGAVVAAEAAIRHQEWYPARADDYGPVFRSTLEASEAVRGVDYAAARFAAAAARSAFNNAFEQVEVVLCPGAPLPAMPLAEFPPTAVLPAEAVAEFVTFTAPMNFSGHPTLSLPCGFAEGGLPVGLQLVGPHLAEQRLLQIGKAYEAATDWLRTPPAAQR